MKLSEKKPAADSIKNVQQHTKGKIAFSAPHPFAKSEPLQRIVSESYHADDEYKDIVEDYEGKYDDAVQKAYGHVMAVPRLGSLKNLDGHTSKWVEDWDNAAEGDSPSVLSSSFGYAIESLATLVYMPSPPQGMSHQLQGTRGNTRPDTILLGDNGDVAWLDITASASQGHIWDKDGWDRQPHVSEVTYPSLKMEHRQIMLGNNENENVEGFDPETFKEQLKQARMLHKVRQTKWKETGGVIKDEIKSRWNKSAELRRLNPRMHAQNPVLSVLIDHFQLGFDKAALLKKYKSDNDIVDIEEVADLRRKAPGILLALNLIPTTYGFVGAGKVSGEAWLLQNDPDLAQPADIDEDERNEKKRGREDENDYNQKVKRKKIEV